MKFSTRQQNSLALLSLTSALQVGSHAFSVPNQTPTRHPQRLRRQTQNQPLLVVLRAASGDALSEVEALRAAAAKARAEADRLSEELGRSPAAVARAAETAPLRPKLSKDEVKALVPTILAQQDVAQQVEQWRELKDSQSLTAFGSANLQTFPVTLSMLEQRTGLSADTLGLTETEVSLDDFKYATLYVAGGSAVAAIASLAFLPPNIGATLCYFFALLPILFLGIGSTAPAVIANAIAGWRNSNSDAAAAVSALERRSRHEAAHFCCGYWCGLPVADYQVGSDNVACVEFGVASNNNYSRTEVAALAVTALAGLVAEAKTYGQALGATQDLVALQAVFRRSAEFLGAVAQQDLTRWGALTAVLLLKQNQDQYEQVVQAFQRQASIEECIQILES